MQRSISDILYSLSKSKFRSSFHLNNKMKEYVNEKGINIIKTHAYEIINKRLVPAYIENDGKQTPMKQVHPIFIAMHACACCCRNCLYKWYKIPQGRELSKDEIDFIVSLLIEWVKIETN